MYYIPKEIRYRRTDSISVIKEYWRESGIPDFYNHIAEFPFTVDLYRYGITKEKFLENVYTLEIPEAFIDYFKITNQILPYEIKKNRKGSEYDCGLILL